MKALRDTDGKRAWAMFITYFPLAFPEICKAREFGARYYSKDGADGVTNWLNSVNTKDHKNFMLGCCRGAISHLFKFLWGTLRDSKQDNVHHLAFAGLNCMMALEYSLAEHGNVKDSNEGLPLVPESGSTPGSAPLYEWKS